MGFWGLVQWSSPVWTRKSLYDRCGNIKQRLVVSLHFYSNNYKFAKKL